MQQKGKCQIGRFEEYIMTTLANIGISILADLEREAGVSDYWDATEVKGLFNELYIEVCKYLDFLRTRDTTKDSADGVKDYDYPIDGVVSLLGMSYNGKPIYPTTITELNAYSRTWRAEGDSTPTWYYFEDGREYIGPSLHPTPDTDSLEIAMRLSYYPTALEDTDEPIEPFKDGILLKSGVLSVCLAKEGEGQNLERSNYYWQLFEFKLGSIKKKQPIPERTHVLRSIEDGGIRGLNLGIHYPPYTFN